MTEISSMAERAASVFGDQLVLLTEGLRIYGELSGGGGGGEFTG